MQHQAASSLDRRMREGIPTAAGGQKMIDRDLFKLLDKMDLSAVSPNDALSLDRINAKLYMKKLEWMLTMAKKDKSGQIAIWMANGTIDVRECSLRQFKYWHRKRFAEVKWWKSPIRYFFRRSQ